MDTRSSVSITFALMCCIGAGPVVAEETVRQGFWGNLDMGVGYVDRSIGGLDNQSTDFYLGIAGGYVIHPRILAGFELSGWNQESTDLNDPTKGEGLMQAFVIGRFYPMRDVNLFAKTGGGWVRQWVNDPGGKSTRDGWGATVGLGYDYSLGENWAVTPCFNFSFGDADGQKHEIFTLGVGITFY